MCSHLLHGQAAFGGKVEQIRGPLAPHMLGLEQMSRDERKEGRKEGRKGDLHPAPMLLPSPDIIPSGNLLTQAPYKPLLPPSPHYYQGFPCLAM